MHPIKQSDHTTAAKRHLMIQKISSGSLGDEEGENDDHGSKNTPTAAQRSDATKPASGERRQYETMLKTETTSTKRPRIIKPMASAASAGPAIAMVICTIYFRF
jgi:hypothetical protein